MVIQRISRITLIVLFQFLVCNNLIWADLIESISEDVEKPQADKKANGLIKLDNKKKNKEKESSSKKSLVKSEDGPEKPKVSVEKKTGHLKKKPKEPILFKSDGQSVYSKEGNIVTLEKNVIVTQGGISFKSESAKVFLQNSKDKNSVRIAEFYGNVRMSQPSDDPSEEVKASGNMAIFNSELRRVDLIGSAQLWRGGHLVKGKKISYFLETEMVTVDEAQGIIRPVKGL